MTQNLDAGHLNKRIPALFQGSDFGALILWRK